MDASENWNLHNQCIYNWKAWSDLSLVLRGCSVTTSRAILKRVVGVHVKTLTSRLTFSETIYLQDKQTELFWDEVNGGFFTITAQDSSILLRMKEGGTFIIFCLLDSRALRSTACFFDCFPCERAQRMLNRDIGNKPHIGSHCFILVVILIQLCKLCHKQENEMLRMAIPQVGSASIPKSTSLFLFAKTNLETIFMNALLQVHRRTRWGGSLSRFKKIRAKVRDIFGQVFLLSIYVKFHVVCVYRQRTERLDWRLYFSGKQFGQIENLSTPPPPEKTRRPYACV